MTEDLPRRPRRRLATPVTAVLVLALVAVLGFVGGVQVQKGRGRTSTGTRTGAFAARLEAPGGQQQADDSTTGTVKNLDGSSFYVTDQRGTTIRVRTTPETKVSRTAAATAGAIHPGDTVVVQGTTASNGTVKATQVTATAKNANGGQ